MLEQEVKELIIEALQLEDITATDIDTDAALFVEGLGLDSIDALELIVMLQQHYGIKVANPQEGPKIFYSVNTISEYIKANKAA